jgi:vancomycin resistance protein YoaR
MLLAVVGALVSSLTADAVASAGRIRAGVQVGSLKIGGTRLHSAEKALTRRAKALAETPAQFLAAGQLVVLDPASVGFFPDVDATLGRAKSVGRGGSLPVRVWQSFRTYFASSDVKWKIDLDPEAARKAVDDWASKFDDPGHEAGIKFEDGKISAVDALPGRTLDRARARDVIRSGLTSWPRSPLELPFTTKGRKTDMRDATVAAERAGDLIRAPITLESPDGTLELKPDTLGRLLEAIPRRRLGSWGLEVRFSPDRVREELEPLMREFERPSQDASFNVSGSTVTVSPSRDGLKFDATKTSQALDDVATNDPPRKTDAAFTVEHPRLTTEQAKGLNIKELVSTFTTRHPAGQPRVRNIHLIADKVDGTVVRPGESFSLNLTAGERTADRGYVLAPMIYDGEFKDQVGGGVSQFATTLFNAVFFGGYQFESYKAHSYYISRYPPGRDATVSWPAPDFKFKNNSPSGILIKASYSASSITVTFYGSREGRTVQAEASERTNITPPPEKREPDPTLAPGAEKVKQEGAEGFDITVWRLITKNGETKRQRFFTRYLPEPRIISVGSGSAAPSASPSAPPPASPTPAPIQTPRTPATPHPATPTPSPTPPGLPKP